MFHNFLIHLSVDGHLGCFHVLAMVCVKSLQLCPVLCDPMVRAHQVPLSVVLSRQEYWRGLPRPSPGEIPDAGIKPLSLSLLHWHL